MKKYFYLFSEVCALYSDNKYQTIYEFEIKNCKGIYIVIIRESKVEDVRYHKEWNGYEFEQLGGNSILELYSPEQLAEIYNVIQMRCHLEDSLKNFLQ